MNKVSKQTVIDLLLDDIPIKMEGKLKEPYLSLVYGGFANYRYNVVSKNWKTSWYREPKPYTPPVPDIIENRFEILDL